MKNFLSHPHIILIIGNDGVVVVPHNIAGVASFFVPSDVKLAMQTIMEFVARTTQARVTLFADNLTQDYLSEDLPPLNYLERRKLIERRLKQTFPAARLTASLRFRKTPHRVLMIGVHESNPVFAWADRLRERLPDIALLPVEGAHLMAKIMPEAADGWAMMVSRQKSGGFRQIVTFKNDLVFTRLTPLSPEGGNNNEAEIIARDIKASLDYLTRHGLHNPKELSVLLLMPNIASKAAAFESLSLKAIRSLSPAQVAVPLALSLAPSRDKDSADVLFASHLLSRLRPVLHLMLPDTRKIWLTKSIQSWGMRVACACLVIVGALTLWHAGDFAVTLYQTQKEAFQLAKTRFVLTQERAHAAPLTEPLGRMRQALERRHIYERPSPTPWQALTALASGIDLNSKIVKLEWKNDPPPALENFVVTLRMTGDAPSNDRAETVTAFSRAVQDIAHVLPDYSVTGVKPPYPALPQESVSATPILAEDPTGEITLERKSP